MFKTGTTISGTLNPAELIPALLAEVKHIPLEGDNTSLLYTVIKAQTWVEAETRSDAEAEILDQLIEQLNLHAPPYTYFGPHPADGSDFGFWPEIAAVEADMHEGYLLRANDSWDNIPTDYHGPIVHINERGNVSLHVRAEDGEIAEVWSLV